MKKHLICTALLGAIFLPTAVFSMPAAAEDASSTAETYTSGDFSYTLDDDGNATLTAYTGGKDLVLPEELDGHPVTKASDYIFADNDTLETVSVSAAMTDLGDSCFFGCDNITSFSVADGNLVYAAQDDILYSKDNAFLIAYPNGKTDKTFTVPDGIEQIGTGAFGYAKLQSITMPDSVTTINEWAFAYSTLTDVTFSPNITAIYDYAFSYCADMKDWNLPEKLEYIGNAAFANCTGMTEIKLPESLTTIGMGAFTGTGLTSITVPASVGSIGYCAIGYQDMTTPVDGFIIYGVTGSKAQEYATETDSEYSDYQNKFTFVPVKDTENSIQDSEAIAEEAANATGDKSKSSTDVTKKDNSKKLLFGIACGVVLLIGGGALLLTNRPKKDTSKKKQTNNQSQSNVSNSKNKSQESEISQHAREIAEKQRPRKKSNFEKKEQVNQSETDRHAKEIAEKQQPRKKESSENKEQKNQLKTDQYAKEITEKKKQVNQLNGEDHE